MKILSKFTFLIILMSVALGLSTNALASATQSIQELQAMAKAGGVKAQVNLGNAYFNGTGIAQNYRKAFYWFEQAANSNNIVAIGNVGYFYLKGFGVVSINYVKAYKLIKDAADYGVPSALNNMGLIYDNGFGQPVNHELAVQYFKKAAKAGIVEANYNIGNYYLRKKQAKLAFTYYEITAKSGLISGIRQLGFMYEFGVGTDKSYSQAYKWFSLGAAKGDKVSQNALQQLEQKMTPAQIAEGKKLVAAHQSQL